MAICFSLHSVDLVIVVANNCIGTTGSQKRRYFSSRSDSSAENPHFSSPSCFLLGKELVDECACGPSFERSCRNAAISYRARQNIISVVPVLGLGNADISGAKSLSLRLEGSRVSIDDGKELSPPMISVKRASRVIIYHQSRRRISTSNDGRLN